MTNENQITDEQRKSLRVQYQVLQQDSSSMVSAHWTVVGIFIGINSALLGAVGYMLGQLSIALRMANVALALGLALILIIVCLWAWLNRVNRLVKSNECMMRKIEKDLDVKVKKKQPNDGSKYIKGIYVILILLWIAAIVGAYNLAQ